MSSARYELVAIDADLAIDWQRPRSLSTRRLLVTDPSQAIRNVRFTALLSARFRQTALLTRWFERGEPPRQGRAPPAKKATRTKKEPWRCAVQRPNRHKSQCQNDDHGQRDARDCIPSSGNDTNANSNEYCCHEKGDEVRNNPSLSNILNKIDRQPRSCVGRDDR